MKKYRMREIGHVEKMSIKRSYKYKTVKAKLRFTIIYEEIYKRGGANITIKKKGRQYFFRMFDSMLMLWEISKCKQISTGNEITDGEIVKEHNKKYGGFFGRK